MKQLIRNLNHAIFNLISAFTFKKSLIKTYSYKKKKNDNFSYYQQQVTTQKLVQPIPFINAYYAKNTFRITLFPSLDVIHVTPEEGSSGFIL